MFVPLTVIDVPGVASFGDTLVIVGRRIVRESALVAVSVPTVTEIGPLTALLGTVTTSVVGDAELTAAAAPPSVTQFCVGTALKPVPEIVTFRPAYAASGVNDVIVSVELFERSIDVMLHSRPSDIGRWSRRNRPLARPDQGRRTRTPCPQRCHPLAGLRVARTPVRANRSKIRARADAIELSSETQAPCVPSSGRCRVTP
jgi:hypothetical protein